MRLTKIKLLNRSQQSNFSWQRAFNMVIILKPKKFCKQVRREYGEELGFKVRIRWGLCLCGTNDIVWFFLPTFNTRKDVNCAISGGKVPKRPLPVQVSQSTKHHIGRRQEASSEHEIKYCSPSYHRVIVQRNLQR